MEGGGYGTKSVRDTGCDVVRFLRVSFDVILECADMSRAPTLSIQRATTKGRAYTRNAPAILASMRRIA